MISDLASALKNPERAVGLSFLTPASTNKIVEVVRGLETNDKTYDFAIRFVKMLEKNPLHCMNRLGI